MPRYLIERKIPNAGKMGPSELHAIAQKSNQVLADLTRDGRSVQWEQSYVTADAINCVYIASGPDVILEHARCGGFPCDNIQQIGDVIDPTTGE